MISQMKPLSPDTTVEAQRMHFELMRRLPGWKRLALAFELTEATRKLVLADIRHRFPDASDEEIRRTFHCACSSARGRDSCLRFRSEARRLLIRTDGKSFHSLVSGCECPGATTDHLCSGRFFCQFNARHVSLYRRHRYRRRCKAGAGYSAPQCASRVVSMSMSMRCVRPLIDGSHLMQFTSTRFSKSTSLFLKSDEFSRKQLERRELREIAPDVEQMIYVATAEDTILAKLRWYDSGGQSLNYSMD